MKIDKGIPLPDLELLRVRTGVTDAMRKMEIGDSVLLGSVREAANAQSYASRKLKPKRFSMRTLTDKTARIWRVA